MNTNWNDVIALDALPRGTMQCFEVAGRQLLIAHTRTGELYAADEMCTHEEASLCLGALVGSRVKCPLHGSWFDLSDGAVEDEPATEPLRTYPLRVSNGVVQVAYEG